MLRSISRFAASIGRSRATKVPLDGAETKSEDYQRDVRASAAQGPMIALIEVKVAPT
jgi:hypothetical protein